VYIIIVDFIYIIVLYTITVYIGNGTIMKKIILSALILSTVILLAYCERKALDREILKINEYSVYAEIANSDMERARGLMYRLTIGPTNGMLFVFEQPQVLRFWMRNCPIPIDVAYISQDWVITDIYTMEPFDENAEHYTSTQPCLYALEVNGGWYTNHAITIGTRITPPDNVTFFTK